MIPIKVDYKSGSSRAAQLREANSQASWRYRQRQRQERDDPPQEDLPQGSLKFREIESSYAITPPDKVLEHCQRLFGVEKSEFEPQQVFIVLKISCKEDDFCKEIGFLLQIMRTRLCLTGHNTEEGQFIKLAIAFHRKISLKDVQLPSTVKNEGHLVEFRDIVPGIWQIKVQFPNFEQEHHEGQEHHEILRGSTAQLSDRVEFVEPTSPPEF